MGALRPFAEGILVAILFGFFIMSFTILFLSQTNPDSEVMTGPSGEGLNRTSASFNQSIMNFSNKASKFKNDLAESKPGLTSFLFLIFEGAFTIPAEFLGLVFNGILIFVSSLFLFGGGAGGVIVIIIATVISTVMLLRLILYIIKTIRTGESER